jgi:anti-sigma regulatory factor (Ser/Thr protein kinase)
MTTVTFPGRYESLAQIGEFIRQKSKEAGLNNLAAYTIETAVDEACSNIIEHAYGGKNIGEIECTCNETDDNLTIILKDSGLPFDPSSIPEPDLNVPLEERDNHGLGLFFMRKWMDEVHFSSLPEGGNVVIMVKNKPRKA